MVNLYVRSSFMDSYDSVDDVYKDQTLLRLAEFKNGVLMSAKNLEKLPSYATLYTLRISEKYRVLLKKVSGDNYILLFVGCHDVVYDWCKKNKKSQKNISTDLSEYEKIEVIFPAILEMVEKENDETEEEQKEIKADTVRKRSGFLRDYSDKDLMLGLENDEELELVRSWITEDECVSGIEKLSPKSRIFMETLIKTGKPDEAVHSLFLLEEHEEMDKKISGVMEDIRNYHNDRFKNSSGHDFFNNISPRNLIFSVYSGSYGGGKTSEIVSILKMNNAGFTDSGGRVLLLVSEPDYLRDTEAYLRIVFGKIPDYLDIRTFSEVQQELIAECASRWKINFTSEDLVPGTTLYDLFMGCMEEIDGNDFPAEDFLYEWENIVENYGLYSPSEYLNHPRIGFTPVENSFSEAFADFIDLFVKKMDETKIYTRGYELKKFSSMCKRKSYKPYEMVYADDIQCLQFQQIEFLKFLSKNNKNLFTYDSIFCSTRPENLYLNDMLFFQTSAIETTRSTRRIGKKSEWSFASENSMILDIIPNNSIVKKNKDNNRDNLQKIPFDGSYDDKLKVYEQLASTISGLETPETTAIVVSEEEDALELAEYLKQNNIQCVIIDFDHAGIDYLLEPGVRICTLRRMGCLAFDNVIIPFPVESMVTKSTDVPYYAQKRNNEDKILSRLNLFRRAVCASYDKTYYLESSEDENLFESFCKDTCGKDV